MNAFLLNFAAHLPAIRRLLNWKQSDLANKTGISRTTIIAIENTPTKLTKTMALAIFVVILYELERRTSLYMELNFNDLKNISNQLSSLGIIDSKTYIPYILGVAAGIGVGIPLVAAEALINFFRKPTESNARSVEPTFVKQYVYETLKHIKNTVREKLGIDSLELRSFIEQLEKHDSEKN